MATIPFAPKVQITQSSDNESVLITDISNYTTNTDGITANQVTGRTVVITDANNSPVATLNLTLQTDGSYTATQSITKDVYYAYLLKIFIGATEKDGTTTNVTTGYYDDVFLQVMQNNLGDCGCKKPGMCSDVSWADKLKSAAIIFGDKGQGLLAQKSIDGANQFMNAALTA